MKGRRKNGEEDGQGYLCGLKTPQWVGVLAGFGVGLSSAEAGLVLGGKIRIVQDLSMNILQLYGVKGYGKYLNTLRKVSE